MIYTYKKHRSLESFMSGATTNISDVEYSLLFQTCNAVHQDFSIDDSCFYCNFCAWGELKNTYYKKLKEISKFSNSKDFFKLKPIKVPNARFHINSPRNKNLEVFTSIEETKRIQLWATSIFTKCTPNECEASLEIPAPTETYDRDGRIDIGIKEKDMFLFVEAKTTLSDAMADERFVEQFTKYTPAIERNLFLDTSKYSLLLLIGGRETDIYPETNRNCTGKTGNLSSRFYNLVLQSETKIPFITATALWLLSIHYLSNNNFSVNQFLIDLFSDNNCYGLVSAGKIIYEPSTGTFNIVKVNLDKI